MENVIHLDVTTLEPRQKHPTIFARYDDLQPGQSLVIHNDHDPKPLYYQLLGERGNGFNWHYLEEGPEWWRVQISKHAANQKAPTLGQLAAKDYRKAQVFKKYGLDFCCGGKKTLKEACQEKNIGVEEVEKELLAVEQQPGHASMNSYNWSPDFLADFIVNTHHQYVKRSLQPILDLAVKVARVHGDLHPETITVATTFNKIAEELQTHLAAEEQLLFPYIHDLVQRQKNGTAFASASSQKAQQPISQMELEHEVTGKNMDYINRLTNGYTLPAGACASYTLLYKWLQEFEDDLHQHVHLENNILFPKAIELEKQLAG